MCAHGENKERGFYSTTKGRTPHIEEGGFILPGGGVHSEYKGKCFIILPGRAALLRRGGGRGLYSATKS